MLNLFVHTLREKRMFIFGWSLGLALLGYLMTAMFTSFGGGAIDELVESLPAGFEGLMGDLQDWKQLPGYIGSQVFDIRFPIFISILSILLAVGLTVGEEDKGQLRTLVSLPLSRMKIIIAKWTAIVLICLVATLATVGGILLALPTTGESLDLMVLVRLGLFTWLMVAALATVIFAVGLSTGKRSVTTTVGIVVTIGSFLLTTFAQSVAWLKDYEWLSFLHYFPAADIAKGTIVWENALFYAATIVVSLILVFVVFPRRDVKAL
ncbi:ABC transporter permease subunit [Candidatus Saccharibacteria bacterium]|nr:ABC transporter permease subunit [Candidatus Saccharibacteria bacterium]NCS82814.1 ABC transporter permease subunit [Candidatus Saccharibacteria bacterium]